MNLSRLFEHWKITENPFRGEEARHDEVFSRLAIGAPIISMGPTHMNRAALSSRVSSGMRPATSPRR